MEKPKYCIISKAPPALSEEWIGGIAKILHDTMWGAEPAYVVELAFPIEGLWKKGQTLYVWASGIKEITEEQANNPLFIALAKESFRGRQS